MGDGDVSSDLGLSAGSGRTAGGAADDAQAQALAAGTVLAGRYEVRALLGAGGMGAVYRVHDQVRRIDIGLKVMLPSLLAREKAVERFHQEAEIMLRLAHPGIVRVFDVGEDRERALRFFTMEMLEGRSLRAWLDAKKRAGEPVDPAHALEITRQLLEALRYAHETTVHRDLKPENVFLVGEPPRVRILDFGIAKLQTPSRFTSTSMALGTAYYMAPEQQLDAAKVDQRADLYSVSVMLYEMLTGELPVGRFKTPTEERKALPRAVDDLVLRGLEPKPERRYESAERLLAEVAAIRALLDRPAVAPRRSLVGPIVAICVSVLLVGGCLVGTVVLPTLRSFQVARERAALDAAERERARKPAPVPEPAPVTRPQPAPETARVAVPKPAPRPAPAPKREPEPEPAIVFPPAESERDPDPAPALDHLERAEPGPSAVDAAEAERQRAQAEFDAKQAAREEALIKMGVMAPREPTPDATAIGVGGGTGGRFGGRSGGKNNLVARGGGSKATEAAVAAALGWLARHQSRDGDWDVSGVCPGVPKCSDEGHADYAVGVTGLAVLAFLGAGHGPKRAEPEGQPGFGDVVRKALDVLVSSHDIDGCMSPRGEKYIYNHAIATIAVAEAYGMTGDARYRSAAEKGLAFLGSARNPGLAWRYSARPGDNDTSVTGWCVEAIHTATRAGLEAPTGAYDGARAWLDSVTEQNGYFQVGYNARSTGKVYAPGQNEEWENHPSMTAVSIVSRLSMGATRDDARLRSMTALLTADIPEWNEKSRKVDMYYWYYGTLALFRYDGPAGASWKKWNEALKSALLAGQKPESAGCAAGSWDPAADRWGREGGRVYTTAIGALTLETYYR